MIYPKCGHQQEAGPECRRCGLIFVRYQSLKERPKPKTEDAVGAEPKKSGHLRRIYRAFRWA
jgi:hypothetical protein